MTPFDRSDRLPAFEQALRDALTDDAGTARTDYLTDILVQTVASRQRPAWTFISRWIPMSVITSRAVAPPRIPVRILVAVALIALVIAGGLLVAGTRSHLPAPFGEAANGLIAYSNEGDILTVDPVTGKTTTIVGTGDVDHDPTWSRDGTHLAFVRDDSGTVQHLYVAGDDGSAVTRITPTPLPNIRDQAFSPDGREVLFTIGADPARQLWIAEADGSGAHRVAADYNVTEPSWAPPSGAEIVFASQLPDDQPNGIYALDPRSGQVRTIVGPTDGVGRDVATVSPDGSQLAYSEALIPWPGGNSYRVRIVGMDGSGERQLPAPATATFQDVPMWSNDGTRLAIVRGYAAHNEDMAIAIVPADGSSAGVETQHGLTGCCDNSLAWSPADDTVVLRPEDLDGNLTAQILIDPKTGATRPAPWGATTLPAQQRRAP